MTDRLYKSFLVFVVLALFVILPDIVYGLVNDKYIAGFDLKSSIITLLFVIFIILSRSYKLNVSILTLFFFWQSSQIMYFEYFGRFYSAFDIELMTREYHDAVLGFLDVADFLVLPAICSTLLFVASIYSLNKYRTQIITTKWGGYLLVVLVLLPFIQSLKSESSQKFQPNIAHSSLKNGLYSHSYFFARLLKISFGLQDKIVSYLPYEVTTIEPKDANVVVIMGESLSYLNMGMFGYNRDTTPDLKNFLENSNFISSKSISSAVSTRVSLALFFNTVYEPNNVEHFNKSTTSLFKLAKEAGYNTHYITTQKNAGALSFSFSPSHIDTWKENKDLNKYDGDYDNRLLLELKDLKLDYNQPQFLTLHMRSAHSPYVDNYPASNEKFPVNNDNYESYMRNSYDNSVLYTQKIITELFNFFKSTNKPTYIFFTADHGELLGQNGQFGHNVVDIEAAKVPFFFYGVNLSEQSLDDVRSNIGCLTNHYLISKYIAKVLGYDITNPNETLHKYYLNGTDLYGNAGYLQYDLLQQKQMSCE